MKILHVVGGNFKSGAFKGAYILHKALVKNKIDSKILNDSPNESISDNYKDIMFINVNYLENKSSSLTINRIIKTNQ